MHTFIFSDTMMKVVYSNLRNGVIFVSLEELSHLQDEIIRKNKTCNLIGAIVFVIVVTFSIARFVLTKASIPFIVMGIAFELIFGFIILTIVKGIVNGKNIRIFYKEFKSLFVHQSLQKHFDHLIYQPEQGFAEEYIRSTGMINTGDQYDSNDYVSGTYKNIKFEQSDIHIEEKHEEKDADGDVHEVWETIFMGRWMIFDFNKIFKANLQVVSAHFGANLLPWKKKFQRVKLEDLEFNKLFAVYAEDEHEAFYILTPHFMEKMKSLAQKLNCGMMFCFIDSKLHIAINNNTDSFEYNVFRKIDVEQIEKDILKDITLITDFVNELDLDNDLFRREV